MRDRGKLRKIGSKSMAVFSKSNGKRCGSFHLGTIIDQFLFFDHYNWIKIDLFLEKEFGIRKLLR